MKKSIQKMFCGLLCLVTAFSVTSCVGGGDSMHSVSTGSTENSSMGTSSEENSSVNSSSQQGSGGDSSQEDSSSSSSENNPNIENPDQGGSGGLNGEVNEPDPEKELVLEEVDTFGHKIAYYSDGTWEDLGRVTPLDFTPKAAASRYGYQQLRHEDNAAGKQNFYNQLFSATLTFYQSGGDVAEEEVTGGVCYPIAKIDCGEYGISYETQQAVWRTFRQDCPEFYFISTQFCTLGDEFWLCVDEDYALTANRATLRTAIENAALECDTYLNGKMNDLERALTINDYLTANVTYSYEADGVTPSNAVWAHNLVGWATMDAGVCETYAESYAYLCELFGLECWTVSGEDMKTGVGHAWNILQLDGVWYNVDVTWNDSFEQAAPEFIDRQWFGMGATEFASTHLADMPTGEALEYQVQLPTLSETALDPVLLKENGGEEELLPSLDKAFEKMTKQGSRYEIILYPDTNAQEKSGKAIYPKGASFTKTELPKTAGLTITAQRFSYADGGYIPAGLDAPQTVKVQGDVTLNDLIWTGGTVDATEGKLILTDGVELKLTALHALEVEVANGTAKVYGESVIEVLKMNEDTALYHLSADNLTLGRIFSAKDAMVYMRNKTALSQVSIGTVSETSLTVRVDFVGAGTYPILKFTGILETQVLLMLNGKVSITDPSPITPSMMTAPVANVAATVETTNLLVYFIQGNTAYQKLYTKDANGNITAND